MAGFRFNLKNPNDNKPTPINLIIRYNYHKVVFYTREHLHPNDWDNKKQIVKNIPDKSEFNTRLENLKLIAKNVFRIYQNDHNQKDPSPNELKQLLNEAIKGEKKGIPTNFIDFFEWFIKQTEKKFKIQNRPIDRNSVINSYRQTLNCIKDFNKDVNLRIDFDTINLDFYHNFIKYLETPKKVLNEKGKEITRYGFKLNNIGKHIKILKRVLNEASSPEINVNKFNYYKKFEVLNNDVDNIYLNIEELNEMFQINLSCKPRHEIARDLFLLGAWTGLRYSDFTNINPKDIKGDYIHIQTQKTGEKVVIPIHPVIKKIMKKYKDNKNSLPPKMSDSELGKHIKEVCSEIDTMNTKESITTTKAGKTYSKEVYKYKLVSSHTARRSFATNMYKMGVPPITIMRITGHRTEKAFLTYIKVTPDEHAKILMNYFREHTKLRII